MITIKELKKLRKDDLFIWALSNYTIPDEITTKKDLLDWLEIYHKEDEEELPTGRKTIIRSRTTQSDYKNYPSALPKGRMV